jgi:L-histidine N-alpha-methyltransferase
MLTTTMSSRLRFLEAQSAHLPELLCQVVDEGLSHPHKSLPCRYFYDNVGSDLFERICGLPEYYLTRSEQSILTQYASDIIKAVGGDLSLIEFGSGSSLKTRTLMNAALHQQDSLHYTPIDISTEFLRQSSETLLEEYPPLTITAIAGEYRDGIAALPEDFLPRLILFLGSNIGNFEHAEAVSFLEAVRHRMKNSDRLLVGADLVKDRTILHAAYNDAQGITSDFNKNLLYRINNELGGDFHPYSFIHDAPFVEEKSRIEMRLISRIKQTVHVRALDKQFEFREGEYIHTENSHKYTLESFANLCAEAGLEIQERWTDAQEWFAMFLLKSRNI